MRFCLNTLKFSLSTALLPVAFGGVHGILGFSGVCCSRSMVRVVSGVLFDVVSCVSEFERVALRKNKTKKGGLVLKLKVVLTAKGYKAGIVCVRSVLTSCEWG
ncbi:MAG: hypothetical protein JOS17DRAFT_573096 [Linnemannia elongata]|nr:MAG: hypothetical protein JOS17DRAFT_573096 [Linnemannia elongata]